MSAQDTIKQMVVQWNYWSYYYYNNHDMCKYYNDILDVLYIKKLICAEKW